MYSAWPLSASCGHALTAAAINIAAAHKLFETGAKNEAISKRFGAKACNCLQIASPVFDPDQKNATRDTLIDLLVWTANEQQKVELTPSFRLARMFEATNRKIHDYLLRQHLSHWHPISTAPANHDLELTVLDDTAAAILPFPCRRTNSGE